MLKQTQNPGIPAQAPRSDGCRLKFWGVRGSIPTPGPATVRYGGNTSCVEVRVDGEIIVLDAGTGIRALGQALAEESGGRPLDITILVSHTHWDHIQGFPFFLPAYNARNHVRILGYEGARASLGATIAGQMESPYFPVALKEMPANIAIEELTNFEFAIDGVGVEAMLMNHPGHCVGYRLTTPGGSLVYMPDNETPPAGSAAEMKQAEFMREADVLIIDGQYNAKEYHHHVGWGHGCIDEVIAVAIRARVRRLFLFHHDPNHDDACLDALLAHARRLAEGSGLDVFAACEGEEWVLRERAPEPSRCGG